MLRCNFIPLDKKTLECDTCYTYGNYYKIINKRLGRRSEIKNVKLNTVFGSKLILSIYNGTLQY
jgi:hypothetical protein